MARTVRHQNLTTRTARSRLPASHEPYWASIAERRHVGYRKGANASSWIARYFSEARRYRKSVLGIADDVLDADGTAVLTFAQAQERARAWFEEQARIDAGEVPAGPFAVADAVNDYLAWFRVRRKSIKATLTKVNAFILPALGSIQVSKLTTRQVRDWHEALAKSPPRARTSKGATQNHRAVDLSDPEVVRCRKSTANRTLTVLKAALNHAYRDGRVADDNAWRRVQPFAEVDAPRVRFLDADEIKRLVAACAADFADLVRAALHTGCRYGELAAFTVGDVDLTNAIVHVARSKGGGRRHVFLTDEGKAFFAALCRDRAPTEPLLRRADGSPWGRSHQHRPLADACIRAKISPAVSFHLLRHTHASHLAQAGTPLMVIAAQLGHADTRMAERHYAHLSASYVAQTIRANMPRLGI